MALPLIGQFESKADLAMTRQSASFLIRAISRAMLALECIINDREMRSITWSRIQVRQPQFSKENQCLITNPKC